MTAICIDDDPAIRALTVRALAKAGFKVESGSSAVAALELAKRIQDVAIIILDVHMPGGSGLDALHILKGDAQLRHIPVLMVSSTAEPIKTREIAMKIGAVGLVAYPVADADLIAAVHKAIEPPTLSSNLPKN